MRHPLIFSCALSMILAACSSSSGTTTTITDSGTKSDSISGGDTNTGGDSSSTTDTGSAGDTSSTTDTTSTGDGATDPTCAAAATNKDCQSCCRTAHTDAYNAFVQALLTCACKSGNCDTACGATACASPPATPDTTCNTCLNSIQSGACKGDIDAVCGSPSGACYPFQQCVATSACNSKP